MLVARPRKDQRSEFFDYVLDCDALCDLQRRVFFQESGGLKRTPVPLRIWIDDEGLHQLPGPLLHPYLTMRSQGPFSG